jgi:hypothetical protein
MEAVQPDSFDEEQFFAALARSAARALLIGRRAMIALGLPVLTADYDLWVHVDDIELLNTALEPFNLVPSVSPEVARQRGRYVLEDGEHIDVLVARSQSASDGTRLAFDDAWARHQRIPYTERTTLAIPTLDDLIVTKRWAMRDKDLTDIRLLEALKRQREG